MHAMSGDQTTDSPSGKAGRAVRTLTFTARFTPVEDGRFQATIDELPSVITAGRSHEEATTLLVDALQTYLLALGDLHGQADPPHGGQTEPLRITVSI